MKAIVCTKYGSPDVLQLREVEKPSPKNNEVLIKIHATTVTSGDSRIRGFRSPLLYWLPMRLVLGITKPRKPILGVELSGEIVALGKDVRRFKQGDQIYAMTGFKLGAYAEYTCLPENATMALKPRNLAYDEAAALPFGGTTSLHFFRKGKLSKGHRVLIYGASGAVGTSAVQLAKWFGAEVTGVCSTKNMDLVKSLGADKVIDYTQEDFTKSGDMYDIVFDAVGKAAKSDCKKMLTPNGRFITVDGQGVAKELVEDMELLKELAEKGKLRPVVDRRYPLEQIPEAHKYVDLGRKRGAVVITVEH